MTPTVSGMDRSGPPGDGAAAQMIALWVALPCCASRVDPSRGTVACPLAHRERASPSGVAALARRGVGARAEELPRALQARPPRPGVGGAPARRAGRRAGLHLPARPG